MSGDLERRYARVLRLYPAAYRRERGPELMATLLESAADGRGRPTTRELSALVLGALRAHAGQERRSARSSGLAACRGAALLLLVSSVLDTPARVVVELAQGAPVNRWLIGYDLADLAALPLGLVALVATLRGRYRGAAVAAVIAFAVGTIVVFRLGDPYSPGVFVGYLFAGVLLVPLFGSAPRPAAGLLRYLPLVPLLYLGGELLLVNASSGVAGAVPLGGNVVLCVVALLWAAVDERVTLAVGLYLLVGLLLRVVFATIWAVAFGAALPTASIVLQLTIVALGPALTLAAAAVAVRGQLRL